MMQPVSKFINLQLLAHVYELGVLKTRTYILRIELCLIIIAIVSCENAM